MGKNNEENIKTTICNYCGKYKNIKVMKTYEIDIKQIINKGRFRQLINKSLFHAACPFINEKGELYYLIPLNTPEGKLEVRILLSTIPATSNSGTYSVCSNCRTIFWGER